MSDLRVNTNASLFIRISNDVRSKIFISMWKIFFRVFLDFYQLLLREIERLNDDFDIELILLMNYVL